MIRFLPFLIQNLICHDHIIDHIAFGDFLRPELLRSRQILSIIITQVIVTDNGSGFDTCVDQEIHQNRFEFGLSGFEIVSPDENAFG